MANLLAKNGKVIGGVPQNQIWTKADKCMLSDEVTSVEDVIDGLGTASTKSYTTTITQSSSDLPTAGAVYSYVDTMITQALTGSY